MPRLDQADRQLPEHGQDEISFECVPVHPLSVTVQVRDGAFLCLSQRLDGEKELVTSDSHARLLFWDCDYAEATLVRP